MLRHRYRQGLNARRRDSASGQTMTEFALVAPLFFMVFMGIIVLGIALFYQQQVVNAAREGARYAALHSATARCPTVSNLSPHAHLLPLPNSYFECDAPAARWPRMTAAARSHLFGLNAGAVQVTACWSSYWTKDTSGAWAAHDEQARSATGANEFRECNVRVYGWTPGQDSDATASSLQVINPRSSRNAGGQEIRVDCSRQFPLTTAADDMGSSFAMYTEGNVNQVTLLSCYAYRPPLAGFLLIPETIHLTGTVTESLEYQQ
jgi:hypothetical protein